MNRLLHIVALLAIGALFVNAEEGTNPYAAFKKSFPKEASFFPIGVWTQNPANAGRYKALGVNHYVGLWKGPNEAQMAELRKHDMQVICMLNDYAAKHLLDDPLVVGWMHADEPDLAHHYTRKMLQAPGGKAIIKKHWPEIYKEMDLDNKPYEGWGHGKHPINDTQADYKRWKKIDDRPIMIQLSKGVALAGKFNGRGDRSGKTWEYPHYIQGSDIVSFDIYPVAYGNADKLYQVADGVDALKKWGSADRPLTVCIEAGFGDKQMANQDQQRAEIWMAINHGADSIIWFVHRWQKKNGKNTFVSEQMPLDDPAIGKAVKNINAELTALAAVINSKEQNDLVSATGATLDLGARIHDGATYVFAVERGSKGGAATISVKGITSGSAEVLNEDRSVPLKDGKIVDEFAAWGTHLYKITK